MNKEFTVKRLEQVRDIFVFCCFAALAFVDIQQLSREHLIKDNSGALWIRKERQKTNQMCNIPVLSIPQRILRKYEDNAECIKKGVYKPYTSRFFLFFIIIILLRYSECIQIAKSNR